MAGCDPLKYLGLDRFRIGRFVVEKGGRLDHAAEITAIHGDLSVSVVYVATGYRGWLNLNDIELVEEHIEDNE